MLLHLMLDTGQTECEPRTRTSDPVLRSVSQMYVPGSYPLPVMGACAEVIETRAGCFCLVMRETTELPLMAVAVAENRDAADDLWPNLLRYCDALEAWRQTSFISLEPLTRPATEPWYATMTLTADLHERTFLRDFCRHFAWGWIDRQLWRNLYAESPRTAFGPPRFFWRM